MCKYEYMTNYKSKKYYLGAEFNSNRCGKVKIIGKCHENNYYIVKFINTGTIIRATTHALREGELKDSYAPIIFGVAYYGDHNIVADKRVYMTWYNMLIRCYDKKYENKCPTYKNVEVCDKWKCFTNFASDIILLPNYDKWLIDKTYVLDKDMLNKGNKQKIYSPDTCMFIPENLNSKEANKCRQQKTIIATRLIDNFVVEFNNVTKFMKEYTTIQSSANIHDCLRGVQKTAKGWTFKYKNE